MARVLVVRAHLKRVARLAAARGFHVVVLKGGVLVSGGGALDVADLDVLVDQSEADAFATALQDAGWQPTGQKSERVAQSLAADGVAIEIHCALGGDDHPGDDVGRHRERLEPVAPLCCLAPLDHLRHVVQHAAIDHLNRRARLRDLLLIAHAARRCSPTDLSSLYSDAETSYKASVCRATLNRALYSPTGDTIREDDRSALTAYVIMLTPPPRFLPKDFASFVDHWSLSMLQTPWERRQIWESARVASLGPSSRPYIRAVEQRSPILGRAWRVAARSAYRAATWIVARPIAAQTRRTVERALASPTLLGS
jgi:hypothetical protein